MTVALALVQLLAVVAIGVFLVRQHRVKPGKPPTAPGEAPPATISAPDPDQYVRRLDFQADISALTRRLATLETTVDERHQALTGLIGNMKRADRAASKDDLAQLVASQLAGRRAAQESAAAPVADNGRRVVRIRRA